METTVDSAEPGLRERKKAATRQALHEAAVRLAVAHGADNFTVEAVADEAGVSRRTFSNYFANKEEALFHGDHRRMATLIDLIRARPAAEDAWTALSAAAMGFYDQMGTLDPQWVVQTRLLRGHPSLLVQQVRLFATLESELAAAVAGRRGAESDPTGLRARLMAATFMTAMRVALHAWLEEPEGPALRDLGVTVLADVGRGLS